MLFRWSVILIVLCNSISLAKNSTETIRANELLPSIMRSFSRYLIDEFRERNFDNGGMDLRGWNDRREEVRLEVISTSEVAFSLTSQRLNFLATSIRVLSGRQELVEGASFFRELESRNLYVDPDVLLPVTTFSNGNRAIRVTGIIFRGDDAPSADGNIEFEISRPQVSYLPPRIQRLRVVRDGNTLLNFNYENVGKWCRCNLTFQCTHPDHLKDNHRFGRQVYFRVNYLNPNCHADLVRGVANILPNGRRDPFARMVEAGNCEVHDTRPPNGFHITPASP